ncbi:MAG: hypothetical protein ACYSWU_04485 [Planctomycetota bacterium]|jgi:hypothetical protein
MNNAPERIEAQTVVAQSFVLTDAEGRQRASMAMTKDNHPAVTLFDNEGKPRAELSLAGDQPQITMYDAGGNARLMLTAAESMTAIAMNHSGSDGDLGLFVKESGPGVAMAHSDQHVLKALVGLDTEGDPVLRMCDSDGDERVLMTFTPSQQPFITLTNKDGGGVSLEPPTKA